MKTKKKMLLFIFAVTSVLLFVQCGWLTMEPAGINLLKFKNNSDIDLRINVLGETYPDTLYPAHRAWGDEINAHESTDIWVPCLKNGQEVGTREEYLADYPIVQIFVLDDKLRKQKIPLDTIRAYNMILRRYELTREWLEEHDWTVVYP